MVCDFDKKMLNAPANLGGSDFLKTTGNVGKHIGDVNIRQLPDAGFPNPEDKLDRVALRRIRCVVKHFAPVCLDELNDFLAMDGGVVHHEQNVFIVEAVKTDELGHVRFEHLAVDRRVENVALPVAVVTDRTDAALRERGEVCRSEVFLAFGTLRSRSHIPNRPVRLVNKNNHVPSPDVRVELLPPSHSEVFVLIAVCSRSSRRDLGERKRPDFNIVHHGFISDIQIASKVFGSAKVFG